MKGCDKRLARVIAQQHYPILVKRWRTGVAPADSIFADVDDAEVFVPAQLAVQIKAVKSFRTKEANEPLAIRAERRVRVCRFFVPRDSGLAGAQCAFPEPFAGFLVKTNDHPALFIIVSRRRAVAI